MAVDAIGNRTGWWELLRRAEAFATRCGALGIFLSWWLVTGLGPSINLTSGVAAYPWAKFLLWDILGEAVWVSGYVTLGFFFSDQMHIVADVLANLGWFLIAVLVAVAAGWELAHYLRQAARDAEASAQALHPSNVRQ